MCSCWIHVKFLKETLLAYGYTETRAKKEISTVKAHEQGVLTRVLGLDSQQLILVKF
jgi:hypothetical protein